MQGRTALVTGGTRGIGRAIVEALIADGRTVAFTWRSDKALAYEVERSSRGRAIAFPLDLRDRTRPATLVREVEDRLGAIEALVIAINLTFDRPRRTIISLTELIFLIWPKKAEFAMCSILAVKWGSFSILEPSLLKSQSSS